MPVKSSAESIPLPSAEVRRSTRYLYFKELLNNARFSDVTFIVDGERVYAHKNLLASSKYLEALFTGPWLDTDRPIVTEGISKEALVDVVLHYMYTGEFQEPKVSDIPGVLQQAELWQLDHLLALTADSYMKVSGLHGCIRMRILSMSHQRCTFNMRHFFKLHQNTHVVWGELFTAAKKFIEQRHLELIEDDPSILLCIDGYDLMFWFLHLLQYDVVTAGSLAQLGRVFFTWLKDCTSTGSISESLVEVLHHMSSSCEGLYYEEAVSITTSDLTNKHCCHSSKTSLGNFNYTFEVASNGEHICVDFFSHERPGACSFQNKWPVLCEFAAKMRTYQPQQESATYDEAMSRSPLVTSNFRKNKDYVGIWWVTAGELLEPNANFVHDDKVCALISISVRPQPVFDFCITFAASVFGDLILQTSLPLMHPEVMIRVLRTDRLNVPSENIVLATVADACAHYPTYVEGLLDCVRFPYVDPNISISTYKTSASIRRAGEFRRRLARAIFEEPPRPRAGYTDHGVKFTADALLSCCLDPEQHDIGPGDTLELAEKATRKSLRGWHSCCNCSAQVSDQSLVKVVIGMCYEAASSWLSETGAGRVRQGLAIRDRAWLSATL
eukprot:TRINITY_DN43491_c0_g1_i1.p1 TRINITY_DN43491_c0_g1~~TRINITY_DN43491_c0_g1_i1.p1  ORF type:complete len:612 (-),score=59.05 TRINITY_DN43491_c0_g1_i1:359-2194(-)